MDKYYISINLFSVSFCKVEEDDKRIKWNGLVELSYEQLLNIVQRLRNKGEIVEVYYPKKVGKKIKYYKTKI